MAGGGGGGRLARAKCTLGHPSQSHDIEANVTHSHGFVEVELNDGDLLDRALVAEQTPTVAAGGGRGRYRGGERTREREVERDDRYRKEGGLARHMAD